MAVVRVRNKKIDRAWNVGASQAAAKGLEVIDAPTRDSSGRWLGVTRANGRPIKPRQSIDEAAAKRRTKAPAEKSAGKAAKTADGNNNPPSIKENQS
jgi:hypothetical protein